MKTIMELADEAGFDVDGPNWAGREERLRVFADLVAANEIAARDLFVMQWQHALRVKNDQAETIAQLRAELANHANSNQSNTITLHDRYSMAALTGLVTMRDLSPETCVAIARDNADAAIKARS